MSVYRPKGSPFYHFDFWLRRNRFFGSTGKTNRRDAEAVEATERTKARQLVGQFAKSKNGPLSLDAAGGRYWIEVGQFHAGKDTTWTNIERLIRFFGPDKPITKINDDDIATLVAWRRGHRIEKKRKRARKDGRPEPLISPATVNRSTIEPLMRILNRARDVWRVDLTEKIDWKRHRLPEPEEHVRELQPDEAARLDAETRLDLEDFFAFAEISGLRLNECFIRWKDVKWASGVIERKGKGKKKVRAIITPQIRQILLRASEHHPEWVFTYICQRGSKPLNLIKGVRYPLTYQGVKSYHRRRKKRASVEDFRFHDYRHDLGTKMLRATGNLKAVQKALNHSNIKTTMKYAHVLDDDLRDAHEKVAESRKKSRTVQTKAKTA